MKSIYPNKKQTTVYIPTQITDQRFFSNIKQRKMFGLHNRYEQANLLSKNKPASIENIRRAATLHKKTKRFQLIIYTFLERPSGWLAGIYQLIMYVN